MVDVPVTSTAVQTDAVARYAAAAAAEEEEEEEETPAGFIRNSVLEENHLMSNLRQQGLKKPGVLERYPAAAAAAVELGAGGRKSWIPWMKKKEAGGGTAAAPQLNGNGGSLFQGAELTMSQKAGQPLHIRVTPDHRNSTATLEITSPRAEDFYSTTTIIPTLGLQRPRITIVPLPPSSSSGGPSPSGSRAGGPDLSCKSPVTITTISRALSPDPSTPGARSPVSVISISTSPVLEEPSGPPELREGGTPGGRTVFRLTPEKQHPSPPPPPPAPARKSNITRGQPDPHPPGPCAATPGGAGPRGEGGGAERAGAGRGRGEGGVYGDGAAVSSPQRRSGGGGEGGHGEDDEQHHHHPHHLGNLQAHAAGGEYPPP